MDTAQVTTVTNKTKAAGKSEATPEPKWLTSQPDVAGGIELNMLNLTSGMLKHDTSTSIKVDASIQTGTPISGIVRQIVAMPNGHVYAKIECSVGSSAAKSGIFGWIWFGPGMYGVCS